MLYISTNEVFDGTRRELYREWDAPNPLSIYARSKAAGEQIVRDLTGGRFYIVRVAWLFGPGGDQLRHQDPGRGREGRRAGRRRR